VGVAGLAASRQLWPIARGGRVEILAAPQSEAATALPRLPAGIFGDFFVGSLAG